VGNYPGRAMGFVVNKATGEAKVTHLPSKHMGVFLNEDTVRILPPPSSPLRNCLTIVATVCKCLCMQREGREADQDSRMFTAHLPE
jgi:hypothetical protein